MRKLKSQIEATLRIPLTLAWFTLFVGSAIGYLGVVYWSKRSELQSLLNVALQTVNNSLNAGDWDIALSHLRAVATSGGVFGLNVDLISATGVGSHLAGPIGDIPAGLFRVCEEIRPGSKYVMTGCRMAIETRELVSLAAFLILGSASIIGVLLFVRKVFANFVQGISNNLEFVAKLARGENANAGAAGELFPYEIDQIRNRLIELLRGAEARSRAEALGHLAAQVAHDIRSPLAALMGIIGRTEGLDEKTRVDIRNAARRIGDIANNLLDKSRSVGGCDDVSPIEVAGTQSGAGEFVPSNEDKSVELLETLIGTVISQKNAQFSLQDPAPLLESIVDDFGLFAEIQPIEFSRVLSNLINNAVEAFQKVDGDPQKSQPMITIRLSSGPEQLGVKQLRLEVVDNGRGIPAELASQMIKRGGTFGKKGGNGLGLSHAKATVESWFGSLRLAPGVERGTVVQIDLPRADAPKWFTPRIIITPQTNVIVLDDDPGIHELWENRFAAIRARFPSFPQLVHFKSSAEILEWYRRNLGLFEHALYLCDYELVGSAQNGLEVIEMLGLSSEAILVTSRADDPQIRNRATKTGVKTLSKVLVPGVPIEMTE